MTEKKDPFKKLITNDELKALMDEQIQALYSNPLVVHVNVTTVDDLNRMERENHAE